MELICSRRIPVEKGLVKNNHNILQGTYNERQKDSCSFSGRKSWDTLWSIPRTTETSSPSILERDSWHSPAASKWQIFLQTAVLRQFHYGTFQTLPSGFKGTCCTGISVGVYLFLYLHVYTWICFILLQNREGRQTEERNVWDLSPTKRDIFKNRHFSAHHIPVISLVLLPV